MKMKYTIIKDGIKIGMFSNEQDRDASFNKYCNDRNASYIKGISDAGGY